MVQLHINIVPILCSGQAFVNRAKYRYPIEVIHCQYKFIPFFSISFLITASRAKRQEQVPGVVLSYQQPKVVV
jgi:hypothetical protein